jgi:hypothetical protein
MILNYEEMCASVSRHRVYDAELASYYKRYRVFDRVSTLVDAVHTAMLDERSGVSVTQGKTPDDVALVITDFVKSLGYSIEALQFSQMTTFHITWED